MEFLVVVAIGAMILLMGRFIDAQEKKTRKEMQEIKTRLHWIKERQKKGGSNGTVKGKKNIHSSKSHASTWSSTGNTRRIKWTISK